MKQIIQILIAFGVMAIFVYLLIKVIEINDDAEITSHSYLTVAGFLEEHESLRPAMTEAMSDGRITGREYKVIAYEYQRLCKEKDTARGFKWRDDFLQL